MRRTVIAGLSLVFLLAGLVPAAVAQQASYSGRGSARALDFSIPAVNRLGLGELFKGLTLGYTSAEFDSSPVARGFASGDCELLAPATGGISGIPCSQATSRASATPANLGDPNLACVQNIAIPKDTTGSGGALVGLRDACAKSTSAIVAGKPVGTNEAKVAAVNMSVDLNALGFGSFLEDNKDSVVQALSGLLTPVFQVVDEQAKTDLEKALGEFLTSIKEGGQFAAITLGDSSTNVTAQGNVTTITAAASGGKVGLLGLTNALSDGLITIEVSAGSATASIDAVKASTSADATAALAKVRFRNLLNLSIRSENLECSGAYCVVMVRPVEINNLLSPLNNTVLETTVDVAKTTKTTNSASSTGVGIHALKGIGATGRSATDLTPGNRDGGLSLRLAAADVSVLAVLGVQIQPPLPLTGGPTYLYWAAAALLAIGAPLLIRVARRLRTTA